MSDWGILFHNKTNKKKLQQKNTKKQKSKPLKVHDVAGGMAGFTRIQISVPELCPWLCWLFKVSLMQEHTYRNKTENF